MFSPTVIQLVADYFVRCAYVENYSDAEVCCVVAVGIRARLRSGFLLNN